MAIKPIILLFIYGQLWWNHTSGKTKGPARVSLDAKQNFPSQVNQPKDPIKNETQMPSSKHQLPLTTEEPKGATFTDEHFIAAVIIGVILLFMILIIAAIFFWRQKRRANLPLPHWAGRSPFADGDMPDLTIDKEPGQSIKRMSVFSHLPWKFNKDTQLLESAEAQLSESRKTLEVPEGYGVAETESQSSHTATATFDSLTSNQTQISEEPSNLTDISLKSETPRLLDPPSSSWPSGVNGDICTPESRPVEQHIDIQCTILPNLPQ